MWNSLFLALVLVSGIPAQNFAAPLQPSLIQDSPASNSTVVPSEKVPQAAADLLKLASGRNGLDIVGAKPWHVKLTFDQFDEDGDNVHSGTLEEFHIDSRKYKRIYTSDTVSRTDVANGTGLFRSGDQSWPLDVEGELIGVALRPLYHAQWDGKDRRLVKTELKEGTAAYPCVAVHPADPNIIQLAVPSFCFQPGTAMLRLIHFGLGSQVTFDSIVPFQGHYVAREITVAVAGKVHLKIHVEKLGEIAQINDAFFAPPPDSKGPLGGRIPMPSASYEEEYQIARPQPVYPRGIEGHVKVNYVVGKDGLVIEATAQDGPEELRKAVLEAVRKYRFRPYLILDQPVEVECHQSFALHSR